MQAFELTIGELPEIWPDTPYWGWFGHLASSIMKDFLALEVNAGLNFKNVEHD